MNDMVQGGRQGAESDLLSVKVNIGEALQMQDFSANKQRHLVKLIGYVNKRSVLVTHPSRDGKLVYIKDGQSFQLRGFSGTKTYEFNSSVIAVCLTPFPYLHLTFPERVKTFTMRSELRIRLKLVCSVESRGLSTMGVKLPSIIEDISASGAKIRASKELGMTGEEAIVSFRLPIDGEDELFILPAIIRNVNMEPLSENDAEGMVYRHGFEFLQADGEYRMALQQYIYKTTLEN